MRALKFDSNLIDSEAQMKYVVKCAKSKLRECEESASKVVLQEELCVAAFAKIFRPWDSHPRLHLVKFLLFSIWNGFVEHLRNGVFSTFASCDRQIQQRAGNPNKEGLIPLYLS